MPVPRLPLALACLALVSFAPAVPAQTWGKEQQEIWKLEEQQWKLSAAKDSSWIETMVHPSLSYWNNAWYSIARENYKKDHEMVTGRYTDVLVKEGGRWLFIAWAGGDDPKK